MRRRSTLAVTSTISYVLLSCASAWTGQKAGIIAHRGVTLEAPENTIPAIERAIALGAAMVEVDPRYTKDGEVVLMHDESLNRTTNGSGRVSEKTLAEIRRLDVRSQEGRKDSGTKVPTLREVLRAAKGKIQVYLDMKEPDPTPVIKVVLETDAKSYVYFRPYYYQGLKRITAADSAFRVLVDLEDWLQVPGILPVLRRAIPTAAFSGALHNWNPGMITEAHRLGVVTFANVLESEDTPENLQRAVSMGFDFIQTDRQLDLKRILDRQSSPGVR